MRCFISFSPQGHLRVTEDVLFSAKASRLILWACLSFLPTVDTSKETLWSHQFSRGSAVNVNWQALLKKISEYNKDVIK